ncbi:MAG TPA: hypothetical protein DDZ88_08015 [Verrucomicrobiales bacterium]|nr:hypothetical protein [Verrucomicrobiales bacterium]
MKSLYANLRGSKQPPLIACPALVVLTTLCGCVQMVEIKNRRITPIAEHNVPVAKTGKGEGTLTSHPVLDGTTQTFPYDPLMWHIARLPPIKSSDGFPVMLDTGLPETARVTLDTSSNDTAFNS